MACLRVVLSVGGASRLERRQSIRFGAARLAVRPDGAAVDETARSLRLASCLTCHRRRRRLCGATARGGAAVVVTLRR